jgi:hypothetical protein
MILNAYTDANFVFKSIDVASRSVFACDVQTHMCVCMCVCVCMRRLGAFVLRLCMYVHVPTYAFSTCVNMY